MSERSFWRVAAPSIVAAVFLTRWPFRSTFLFSWDSANYALAMERIDIAAHRPHPPGYLAYVVIAKVIHAAIDDVNASLVLWNIVATVVALLVLVRLAWEVAEGLPGRAAFAAGTGIVAATSPLLWFYGEVAEIYVSEMLAATALVYTSWRVLRLRAGALYWSAVCVPLAAAFKLTTALFLLPMVGYAWSRAPVRAQMKAGALLVACTAVIMGAFVWITPNLADSIRQHFEASTSATRLSTAAGSDTLERLNHNFRNSLTATIAMVGVVNFPGLLYWALRDRQLPRGFPRSLALLWTIPWLVLCLGLHMSKPGYLLPLLPFGSLVLANLYVRLSINVYLALLISQSAVNVGYFMAFAPLPPELTGGTRPYRQKTVLQRLASDMQPLTAATAATIGRSDANVAQLLTEVERRCPAGNAVVIAGTEPVDARRVMWYVPGALVIHVDGRSFTSFAVRAQLTPVTQEFSEFATNCPVFWLAPDSSASQFELPATATRVPGLGFVIDATAVRVTSTTITFVDPQQTR